MNESTPKDITFTSKCIHISPYKGLRHRFPHNTCVPDTQVLKYHPKYSKHCKNKSTIINAEVPGWFWWSATACICILLYLIPWSAVVSVLLTLWSVVVSEILKPWSTAVSEVLLITWHIWDVADKLLYQNIRTDWYSDMHLTEYQAEIPTTVSVLNPWPAYEQIYCTDHESKLLTLYMLLGFKQCPNWQRLLDSY